MLQTDDAKLASLGTKGHYGFLKDGDRELGGFINWIIGGWKGEWKATSRNWWLYDTVPPKVDVYFYRIVNGKETFVVQENVRVTVGSNTKNKLVKSLLEMFKE